VLAERHYRDGHLPGALPLPPAELASRIERLAPDPGTPIIVYCASATCRSSHQAAAALVQRGYRDVRVYAGGKADWADAGLPLEREPRAGA
jgi:rhodanese-related sulfurtransferase